jgi:aspartate/methionine/tyrosine aminotransferase
LTIGISELPEPEEVKQVLSQTVWEFGKTHQVFPEGLPDLREGVASFYNEQFGAEVTSNQVIVNTGTSAIFRNFFQILCSSEYEILLPFPYYSLYRISAILAGAAIRYYNIDQKSLRVDMNSFVSVFNPKKTALVVINSPGNPLGNILNYDEILAMYQLIGGEAFVIHDDIYVTTCF